MTAAEVQEVRGELRDVEGRLSKSIDELRGEVREMGRKRDDCERDCGERRKPIYERLRQVELGQRAASVLVGVIVGIGGSVLTLLANYLLTR